METIQVGQLKTDFSAILQEVQNSGKKYIIEYGRKQKKVAMIVPYQEEVEERNFGLLAKSGSFNLHDDFEMTDEEFLGL